LLFQSRVRVQKINLFSSQERKRSRLAICGPSNEDLFNLSKVIRARIKDLLRKLPVASYDPRFQLPQLLP